MAARRGWCCTRSCPTRRTARRPGSRSRPPASSPPRMAEESWERRNRLSNAEEHAASRPSGRTTGWGDGALRPQHDARARRDRRRAVPAEPPRRLPLSRRGAELGGQDKGAALDLRLSDPGASARSGHDLDAAAERRHGRADIRRMPSARSGSRSMAATAGRPSGRVCRRGAVTSRCSGRRWRGTRPPGGDLFRDQFRLGLRLRWTKARAGRDRPASAHDARPSRCSRPPDRAEAAATTAEDARAACGRQAVLAARP